MGGKRSESEQVFVVDPANQSDNVDKFGIETSCKCLKGVANVPSETLGDS